MLEVTDDRVGALKNVTFNEPALQGHFPGAPDARRAQIEAMAQAGASWRCAPSVRPRTHAAAVHGDRRGEVSPRGHPGDQLIIEVVPLRKGKIFKMKGEIQCDGQVVSSAEFLAGLAEKSKVV